VRGDLGCKHETGLGGIARTPSCLIGRLRPNGSRFSCGRTARGRNELEPQTKRLASEGTQFFPHERPDSFKRLLGSNPGNVQTSTGETLWLVFCR